MSIKRNPVFTKTKVVHIRMTERQRARFNELGGAHFLREWLDEQLHVEKAKKALHEKAQSTE